MQGPNFGPPSSLSHKLQTDLKISSLFACSFTIRVTQLFVLQGGIFKLIHVAKIDGTTVKHNAIFKGGFKAFTMIPLSEEEAIPKNTVMAYADHLITLPGFETLNVYKLHNSSGPSSEWLYEWIIEALFNSVMATEESVLKDLMNFPSVTKKWEISIFQDYMQMGG